MARKIAQDWDSVPAWAHLSPAELEEAEGRLVASMTREDFDLAHWVEIGALGVGDDPVALAAVRLRQLSEIPESLRDPLDWGDLVGYWRHFDLLPDLLPARRLSLVWSAPLWPGRDTLAGFAWAA